MDNNANNIEPMKETSQNSLAAEANKAVENTEVDSTSQNALTKLYKGLSSGVKKEKKEEVNYQKMVEEALNDTAGIAGGKQTKDMSDAEKHAGQKKATFKYTIVNSYGQTVQSLFDAYSIDEVQTYLINEGYQIVSIAPCKKYEVELTPAKIGLEELAFTLTQLSTYVKAGIPLVDSVRILAKQTTVPSKRKIYERLVYDLVTGDNFSTALDNQGEIFPRLLINMVKTSEMTGDLPSVLDEMAEYYTSIDQTRKDVKSALMYPLFIIVFAVIVVVFILVYVVPQFVSMYSDSGAELPWITQFTLNASDFLVNYGLIILAILAIIGGIYGYTFKHIQSFRKKMQTFYMHLPVVKDMIIFGEVSTFTRTFASLLNHSVNINESMKVLSNVTSNEVYKEIIAKTMLTLSKGGKISESFRGQWAFPLVAYEMLVTGESTGQLGEMMEKVSEHYDVMHKRQIGTMKSMIEPITMVVLTVVVGFILMSIVIPMFDVYNTVQ